MRRGANMRSFTWQPSPRNVSGPCEYLLLQKLPRTKSTASVVAAAAAATDESVGSGSGADAPAPQVLELGTDASTAEPVAGGPEASEQ
jgi:hypothetical protein